MTGLPYTNAQVTSIAGGGGTSRDYDNPGTDGTARWTGSLSVTVRQTLLEELAGEQINEVVQTRVKLPYAVGMLVKRGDTITFIYEGATQARKAGTIVRSQMTDRVSVTLEDS